MQGAADAAFSSDAPHIQQHAIQQQLQQQLQEKEQQLLDLQAQQDSSGSPENDVSLEQLRAELADRTQELIEWQIHADVSVFAAVISYLHLASSGMYGTQMLFCLLHANYV